jgi:hypothetical protein
MANELSRSVQFESGTSADEFKRLIEGIAEFARRAGLKVQAGTERSWAHYRSLPQTQKAEIFVSAKNYFEICEATIKEGSQISETASLLWMSLKHFGLFPGSDLMDRLTNDMVVEVYNQDGIQIFRNMKFMEVCSYTIADVFIYPWWELFKRNDELLNDLKHEIGQVLEGKTNKLLESKIRRHRIVESFSVEQSEIEMKIAFFGPIFHRGTKQIAGFVAASEATVLSAHAKLSKPAQESNPVSLA